MCLPSFTCTSPATVPAPKCCTQRKIAGATIRTFEGRRAEVGVHLSCFLLTCKGRLMGSTPLWDTNQLGTDSVDA